MDTFIQVLVDVISALQWAGIYVEAGVDGGMKLRLLEAAVKGFAVVVTVCWFFKRTDCSILLSLHFVFVISVLQHDNQPTCPYQFALFDLVERVVRNCTGPELLAALQLHVQVAQFGDYFLVKMLLDVVYTLMFMLCLLSTF